MLEEGDTAPQFTAPLATGDVDSFDLDAATDEEPVVLAFFPGAFTSVCSHELAAFEDEHLDALEAAGVRLIGVSRDSPFALNAFREDLDLSFGLASDLNREVVEAYDLSMDFPDLGVEDVAKRSVVVVDGDRDVEYAWISDDPGVEPPYDEVLAAAERVGE